jgi:hypothetical protein
MRIWTAIGTVGLALATLGAGPCDDGGSDPAAVDAAAAQQAVATLDAMDQMSGVLATVVDDVDPTDTPEAAAAFAAGHVVAALSPAGCVTAAGDPGDSAHETFTFAGCDGPFALTGVSGALSVYYSLAVGGGIKIEVLSSSLVIAGRTHASVHGTGSYVKSGAARRLTVDVNVEASDPLHYAGMVISSWDEGAACRSLDGVFTSSVGGNRAWTATAADLVRCAGGCPESGATLSFVEEAPGTGKVSLGFGGGAEATWTAEDGATGTVPLPCGH